MKSYKKKVTILIADDDEEDRMLVKEALEETPFIKKINFVQNGQELIDYLFNHNEFQDRALYPTPCLILLDLNMPKKDGREALKEIKADEKLCSIPVVVFTTSQAEEDVLKTYQLGASSFIIKPITYSALLKEMQVLCEYYFQVAETPYV